MFMDDERNQECFAANEDSGRKQQAVCSNQIKNVASTSAKLLLRYTSVAE